MTTPNIHHDAFVVDLPQHPDFHEDDTDDSVPFDEALNEERYACISRAQPVEARQHRRKCGKRGKTVRAENGDESHCIYHCGRSDHWYCARKLAGRLVSPRIRLLVLAMLSTRSRIRTDALCIEDPRLAPPPAGCRDAEERGGRLCQRRKSCADCERVRRAHDARLNAEEEIRERALALVRWPGIVGAWAARLVPSGSALVVYVISLEGVGVVASRRRRNAAGALQPAPPARPITAPLRNDAAIAHAWSTICAAWGARGGHYVWHDSTPEAVVRRLWQIYAPLAGDVERAARAGQLTSDQILAAMRCITLSEETRATPGAKKRKPLRAITRAGWLGGLANNQTATVAALRLRLLPRPEPFECTDVAKWGIRERLSGGRLRVRHEHDGSEHVIQLTGREPAIDARDNMIVPTQRPRIAWDGQVVQIRSGIISVSGRAPNGPAWAGTP